MLPNPFRLGYGFLLYFSYTTIFISGPENRLFLYEESRSTRRRPIVIIDPYFVLGFLVTLCQIPVLTRLIIFFGAIILYRQNSQWSRLLVNVDRQLSFMWTSVSCSRYIIIIWLYSLLPSLWNKFTALLNLIKSLPFHNILTDATGLFGPYWTLFD